MSEMIASKKVRNKLEITKIVTEEYSKQKIFKPLDKLIS